MKVLTVVGARPQFIKAAPVSRALRPHATEVLVHTGQHFDANMSDIFFAELGIPAPDHHLGIGGGLHGEMTGAMLSAIEKVILDEKPDWVMVYGDTNSTLAGALAAVKLHVPVAHVEAGLRSFNRRMPEEINRVLTDHAADVLLAPTQTAVDHLACEGITRGVHRIGDVMLDATLHFKGVAEQKRPLLDALNVQPGGYYLATIHRAENTDDPRALETLLATLATLDRPTVLPLHPRTRKRIADAKLDRWLAEPALRLIEPVGYLEMLLLESRAAMVLTDSGGVQKEAYFLGVPCRTLRGETEWVETLEGQWNMLVGCDREALLAAIATPPQGQPDLAVFGNGHASARIAEILLGASVSNR